MRGAREFRTARSRRLRRDATEAEKRLWWRLRARGLGGCKFVRQEPVGPFTVDFICRERRLIVELDGGQHADNQADLVRDHALEAQGYRVLRFWNNDVMSNLDGVLYTIATTLVDGLCVAPHPDR